MVMTEAGPGSLALRRRLRGRPRVRDGVLFLVGAGVAYAVRIIVLAFLVFVR